MKAKRYNDAVDEYRDLAIHATAESRPAAELALADALHRSGRNREAKSELTTLVGCNSRAERATPVHPRRGRLGLGRERHLFYRTVDQLRQAAPTSPWLEAALLSVANLHLVHHEYDQALDAFRELQQRFPNGIPRLVRALEGCVADPALRPQR